MVTKISVFLGIFLIMAVLFGSLTFSQSVSANNGGGQEKVTICHVDEKTGEETTITVGEPGAAAHLKNHPEDTPGECTKGPLCEPLIYELFDQGFVQCVNDTWDFESCANTHLEEFQEASETCELSDEGVRPACLETCDIESITFLLECHSADEGPCDDDAFEVKVLCLEENQCEIE